MKLTFISRFSLDQALCFVGVSSHALPRAANCCKNQFIKLNYHNYMYGNSASHALCVMFSYNVMLIFWKNYSLAASFTSLLVVSFLPCLSLFRKLSVSHVFQRFFLSHQLPVLPRHCFRRQAADMTAPGINDPPERCRVNIADEHSHEFRQI